MKITIGDPSAARRKTGRVALPHRRTRDEAGELVTVYTLDLNAESLSDDLHTVFKRNVARARRESRALAKSRIAAE